MKEYYHISRDRWTMIILLLLPVLMLILFGFMMTNEVRNTSFAVLDPSRDALTLGIVNKLSMNEYFIFEGYLEDSEDIDKLLKNGKLGLILVFSENYQENSIPYGDAAIQLISDGSDPNTATTVTMYAGNIIKSFFMEQAGYIGTRNGISVELKFLYNPTLKGAFNFVPGVMGMILMLICAMMTSVSIAREKESGTMELLLVSPMQSYQIIVSKVIPYFAISVINLTTILLFSVFLLDVPIQGSLLLLVSISLIFIIVSLSLGILISSLVDKQMTALLISALVLFLPVIMLSGMMFPVENMPWILQVISELVPAKWYLISVKKVMIQGLGLASIRTELLVLSLMALLLLTASIKRFKYRLE